MYISFRTRQLERCYRELRKGEASWGEAIAQKYMQAMDLIKAVEQPPHLGQFRSFNYHQLKGNRKGQHVLELGRRARLIFTVRTGATGLTARIEEVSVSHYDD